LEYIKLFCKKPLILQKSSQKMISIWLSFWLTTYLLCLVEVCFSINSHHSYGYYVPLLADCNHNPVLSSFMTYHWIDNNSITTGATCGAGTAYPSGATSVFFIGGYVARFFVFCVMFCRSLFVLLTFFLAIALSALRFVSNYPFDIFKLSTIIH
jgi:hypothetical protein